jgi:porin
LNRVRGRFALSLLGAVLLLVVASPAWTQERGPEREGEEEQEAVADQEVPERERRPRFGGPDQVENQLEEDAAPKEPLVQFDFLKPYLDFKARLKESSGFSFGVDYTAVYLGATESVGEDEAASGMVRLFGAWEFVGRGSSNAGALVYKVEHRHKYTSIAPGSLGFDLGYVGLIEPPFSDADFVLGNFYWRQKLAGGRIGFFAGWVDATDYVDVYALASPWLHFMNFVFSTGSASIPVPNQGLGVAAGVFISNQVYAIAGLADSNSDPTRPWDGFDSFFSQAEYFKHVEVGWTTSQDRVYLDNIHVTFWHADEREEANVPDGWGLNFSATRYIDDKWLPFLRAGYAKDGGSLLQRSVSVGFGYQWVPYQDLAGFGFNWGQPNETTFEPGLDDQYSLEGFYRFQLAGQLALTPDVQLLFNPVLNPDASSTWVFGIRARLAL